MPRWLVALVVAAILIALGGAGLGTAAFVVISAGPSAGRDGIDGDPGADGTDGATGPSGAPGTPGAQGPVGPQGPRGGIGATGPAGSTGTAGADGVDGVDGIDGADADNTFSARFTQVEYILEVAPGPTLVTYPDPATVLTNGTDVAIDDDSFTIQTSGYYEVTYGLQPVQHSQGFFEMFSTYILMNGGLELVGSRATYFSAIPQGDITTVAHFDAGDQGSVYIDGNGEAADLWVYPKLIFILIDAD